MSLSAISFGGLLYAVAKDIINFLKYTEEEKLVDLKWLEASGFGEAARKSGFDLRWVVPKKIESKKLIGYQILYEIDETARARRRIVAANELILMGKPRE